MIKKLFTCLLFSFVFLALSANPIINLIKDAGGADEYPDANLLTIFDSTMVDVQESGLSFVNIHKLYKVLTAKGAQDINDITFGYDPLSAYVDIQKVIIYRKNGSIESLDMSKVMDYPAPARMLYWGAREKMIEVGRLEPGDAVEVFLFRKGFTYALLFDDEDDRYIPPMRGHFYDIVEFWSNEPIKEKVYQTRIPRDKLVQYEFYNGEVQCSAMPDGEKMVYTFARKDIKPFKREPWMVSRSDVAPKLLISTSPDWYAKSLWFYGVNEDFGSFDVTPEVKAKVDEILEGAVNEMDSISRLTHWAADEIRYSGISMGEGEGYTLHKGEMIFLDRCGVCKDKAGMLVTMLRAAGFESYAAMTMAGSRIDYIPADQFNHSVTLAKLSDGEYHLLDPTWVPFVRELWSSAEQQQNYLMGIPEGADLKITPLSPPENHFIRITGNSEIQPDGTLTGNLTLIAEGQSDASIRGLFVRYPKSAWESNIEREIKRNHPLARITETNYKDPYDYMSGPIILKINFTIPDFALITGDEIIFTPLVATEIFTRGMIHMYMNTSLKERKYGFRDRCSRLVKLEEQVKLPGKVSAIYLPEEESFDTPVASFEGNYQISLKGSTLRLFERIAFKKRIYENSDWPDYSKAVAAQQKFAREPVILKLEN